MPSASFCREIKLPSGALDLIPLRTADFTGRLDRFQRI